jgi:hypothetical protein
MSACQQAVLGTYTGDRFWVNNNAHASHTNTVRNSS